MVLKEVIEKYKPLIERKLKEVFYEEAYKGPFEELKYFYSSLEEFTLRGGKRLRPIALIMAYRSVKNLTEEDEDKLAKVATCVELLHNSTLIHDDIIDRDRLRRGKPSFHVIFENRYSDQPQAPHIGISYAILGGDELFNIGFKVLANAPFKRELILRALNAYTRAYSEIVCGEILDIYFSIRRTATLKDYFKLIELKTASLFKASIEIGLILAESSEENIHSMLLYADNVAKAFQIKDDILGLYGTEEKLGKPIGSDLREGKATILTVLASESLPSNERNRLLSLLGKEDISLKDIEWAREILIKYNVKNKAEEYMTKFSNKALRCLSLCNINEYSKRFFTELIDYIMKREY